MFYRLTSASGTTSSANEDIWAAMRLFTSITDEDDTYYPFRPRMAYFEADADTTISANGDSSIGNLIGKASILKQPLLSFLRNINFKGLIIGETHGFM